MLGLRRCWLSGTKLTDAGEWRAEVLPETGRLQGMNAATRDWLIAARSDFSRQYFKDEVEFSNSVFPGDVEFAKAEFANRARFRSATFGGYAGFGGATFSGGAGFGEARFTDDAIFREAKFIVGDANFEGATFSGDARFRDARFSADARFQKAKFSSEAEFREARFSGGAGFGNASFGGYAGFHDARFRADAEFWKATFRGYAGFQKATFRGRAEFGKATFGGDAEFWEANFGGFARFSQAIFESFANFSRTTFQKEADFVAIKGHSFFTLKNVKFLSVPNFEQAHFEEAPRLDHSYFRALGDEPDIAARWRALRRLATQGHDHERELDFLAEEIKSLRGDQDRLLPNPRNLLKGERVWLGGGRYWAGLFYQIFSDFGRSMLRPFLWWVIITLGFTMYYLSHYLETSVPSRTLYHWALGTETDPTFVRLTCLGEKENLGQPLMAAFYLSISNALVVSISGLGRSEKLAQSYACLYGKNERVPIMPDAVVLAGIVQTILSAVLIFLFLLALRNYFRIK